MVRAVSKECMGQKLDCKRSRAELVERMSSQQEKTAFSRSWDKGKRTIVGEEVLRTGETTVVV